MLHRIATAAGEVTGTESAGSGWGESDIGGRADIWAQSFAAFSDRPIGGVGLSAHRDAVPVGKEAHNTYLSVLTETGIVGFLAFATVLAAIWMYVRRHRGWNRWYWCSQLAVIAIGRVALARRQQVRLDLRRARRREHGYGDRRSDAGLEPGSIRSGCRQAVAEATARGAGDVRDHAQVGGAERRAPRRVLADRLDALQAHGVADDVAVGGPGGSRTGAGSTPTNRAMRSRVACGSAQRSS